MVMMELSLFWWKIIKVFETLPGKVLDVLVGAWKIILKEIHTVEV